MYHRQDAWICHRPNQNPHETRQSSRARVGSTRSLTPGMVKANLHPCLHPCVWCITVAIIIIIIVVVIIFGIHYSQGSSVPLTQTLNDCINKQTNTNNLFILTGYWASAIFPVAGIQRQSRACPFLHLQICSTASTPL